MLTTDLSNFRFLFLCFQKGEIILVWAYKNTVDSLARHDKRGFATVTMISANDTMISANDTMISASEAVKVKSLLLACLSIAVAFLFK